MDRPNPIAVRQDPLWVRVSREVEEAPFPQYRFEQKISMPFLGINGPGRAMLEAQWPFELQNGIDIRREVMKTLRFLHGENADLVCADITKIPEESVKPTHGFIGTSPCEDFSVLYSGLNSDGGIEGSRGNLFMVQLQMIERMAHNKTTSVQLKWVMLESCKGFLAQTKKGCAWEVVREWWSAHMYDFTPLAVWEMQLLECSSPNSRGRVILVSFARSFMEATGASFPSKPKPHPAVSLEDFLRNCNQHITPSDITTKQYENLQKWNEIFQQRVAKLKYEDMETATSLLGITDISRDPGKKFQANVRINEVPIFTTRNNHLAIMKLPNARSTKCVGLGRLLSMEERCEMLGVVPESLVGQSQFQTLKSLGGMFPVNMAGVALREVMCLWEKYENKLLKIPPAIENQENQDTPIDSPPTPPCKRRKLECAKTLIDSPSPRR